MTKREELVEACRQAMREEDPIPLTMFADSELDDLARAIIPLIAEAAAKIAREEAHSLDNEYNRKHGLGKAEIETLNDIATAILQHLGGPHD